MERNQKQRPGFGVGQLGVFVSRREQNIIPRRLKLSDCANSFSELHINVKAAFSAFVSTMVYYSKELSANSEIRAFECCN